MATTTTSLTPKRIHLSGSGRHYEDRAGGVIRPGDLIDRASTDKMVKHPSAGGHSEKAFALEDALQGRDIDVNYAADELVGYVIAQPGDVVYAWLSGGEVVTLDDFLTSNGDGALKVAGSTDQRIAKAIEAKNASDSNDVDERIKVRIL